MLLLLLTEELKKSFDVGIEFNNLVYEPQYEDLKDPTMEEVVQRIEAAVRVIFYNLETTYQFTIDLVLSCVNLYFLELLWDYCMIRARNILLLMMDLAARSQPQ